MAENRTELLRTIKDEVLALKESPLYAERVKNKVFSVIGDYITNIVKDRPPFNRDPLPEEIRIYGPFLDRQIDIIQPAVIATLGRFSMEYIMRKFGLDAQLKPISKMHGTTVQAEASYGPVTIIPLYHPAVAIYNQSSKDTLIEDFKILKDFI